VEWLLAGGPDIGREVPGETLGRFDAEAERSGGSDGVMLDPFGVRRSGRLNVPGALDVEMDVDQRHLLFGIDGVLTLVLIFYY
jgi:hypothetical protein